MFKKKLALILFSLAISANSYASEDVLSFDLTDKQPSVKMEVNGVLQNFLVDPSLEAILVLAPKAITDSKIVENKTTGRFFSPKAMIDGHKFKGDFGKAYISSSYLAPDKYPVMWFKETPRAGFDGVIGAPAFENETIEFINTPTSKKMNKYSYKVKSKSHWVITETVQGKENSESINLVWNPYYKQTKVNLTAADILADMGVITLGSNVQPGERGMFDVTTEVVDANLPSSFTLLHKSVSSIKAQIYVGSMTKNSDDVVATKKTNKKRRREKPTIILGRDFVDGCQKVTFERESKTLNFYCP